MAMAGCALSTRRARWFHRVYHAVRLAIKKALVIELRTGTKKVELGSAQGGYSFVGVKTLTHIGGWVP